MSATKKQLTFKKFLINNEKKHFLIYSFSHLLIHYLIKYIFPNPFWKN